MCTSRRTDAGLPKNKRKELDISLSRWSILRDGQTFKNVVEKENRAGTQFDVTSRGRTSYVDKSACWVWSLWPCGKRTRWTKKNRQCASEFPRAPVTPQVQRERCTRRPDTRSIADGVDGVLREQRMNRFLREQQPETCEAVSRIEFESAELGREEDRTLSTSSLNVCDDGSESLTATLCSTKDFSEHLTESRRFGTDVGETWSKPPVIRARAKIRNVNQVIS